MRDMRDETLRELLPKYNIKFLWKDNKLFNSRDGIKIGEEIRLTYVCKMKIV